MDSLSGDFTLQDVLGRGGDFVGGIDNEALDFSQLEAFINSDTSQNNGNYFGESLGTPSGGKLLNVIVEPKRPTGHSLPDSPPDSSSEHPYSPQENCENNLNTSDNIYSSLGQQIYKPTLLNPIITDNLIIGSHIVVSEQNSEPHLLENGNILQDNRLLDSEDLRSNSNILNGRLLQENDGSLLSERIILPDGNLESNRQLLIGGTNNENSQSFVENCQRNESLLRRNTNELLLVKNPGEFEKTQLVHLGYNTNVDIPPISQNCDPPMDNIQAVYTNLQNVSKKRKLSQDVPLVKSEPEHCSPSQLSPPSNLTSPLDDDYAASDGCLTETQYQCIRFTAFQQTAWHALCDQNLSELPVPHYRVDADKGFNFSNADDAFVCQKKNHFQVTCHVQLLGDAQFVKTTEGFQKISSFHLHFYGVKHDCPTQTIRVEQSQSDRSKKPFHPVLVELVNSQVTKVTVGRLHFSETTSNNMRKKGKPNPEQRYFQLVVGLHAHTTHGNFPVISHASQKIIVRASNPGQFENDVELCWQKGQTQDSIFHAGKVGINTDRPDESLVVHGNLKITGHIIQPSDIRAKKNIVECDTKEQLRNVQRLRVVRYEYEPEFASQLHRPVDTGDTGVIAQEVAEILPEAVSPAGNLVLQDGTLIDNFLVVNKERIFIENIGAVKELCKVTDNLETRIDQLERINRRLNKLKRGDSLKSTINSVKHVHTKKCFKHRTCSDESELCSTKFIQIIIIVLVLIMAFCLAAITTLYLIDASRHRSLDRNNYQYKQSFLSTNAPTKLSKLRTWPTVHSRISTVAPSKEPGITRPSIEITSINKEFSRILGRPSDCITEPQSYDATNACQIHCCGSLIYEKSNIIGAPVFKEKISRITHPKNKTVSIALLDKNKVGKSLNNNNIDKHPRKKRENDDINDKDNSFDTPDDHHLKISIQGKNFSTELSTDYLVESRSSPANYTYNIPISKYMPDPFIRVVFRSHQKNIVVEHCSNTRVHPCPFVGLAYADDNKTQPAYKVNENVPIQPINDHTFTFEVDMLDYQSKTMTYRYTYRQNQNTCKISSSKLGVEFTEYNFIFYRHCDE